jgi:hypothetical protein
MLHVVSHVHNLFNTIEAPCQVTNLHYHELSAFLHSIMPRRPLGLHYSTIGFHHFAKVAVMNEVRRHLGSHGELLDTAPGFPGTVAIAFTSPRSDCVLKVIRTGPLRTSKMAAHGCGRRPTAHKIPVPRGCSSMVELQLPKLLTWVRFPSPAPFPAKTSQ